MDMFDDTARSLEKKAMVNKPRKWFDINKTEWVNRYDADLHF